MAARLKPRVNHEPRSAHGRAVNKDGSYKITYSPKDQGRYRVTVKVNGKHVLDSPFSIDVKLSHSRLAFSFGKEGSSVGMFKHPWGVAVNARDEIAVTDSLNQSSSL